MSATATDIARAQALLDIGRPREAIDLLSRTLASQPNDATAWSMLANAHLQMGDWYEALESAREAIGRDPHREWAYRIASIAHRRRGEPREAIDCARESARLAPHLAVAHAELGVALSHGGARRWREAAREIGEAIRLAPLDPAIHHMAGDAALGRHRRRRAEHHYARALELDPAQAGTVNNLALARGRRGRAVSALSGFGRAAALNPRNAVHRHNVDVTITRITLYAIPVLMGVSVLVWWQPRVPFAGGLLLVLLGVYWRGEALRAWPWVYLRQVTLRRLRTAIPIAGVLIGFCVLLVAPLIPGDSAALAGILSLDLFLVLLLLAIAGAMLRAALTRPAIAIRAVSIVVLVVAFRQLV